MSTHRTNPNAGYADYDGPRGASGRLLCRRCQVEVPKGRRTFCGQPCVDAWRLTTDPAFLRRQVYKRDKGVCAGCGLDTHSFQTLLDKVDTAVLTMNKGACEDIRAAFRVFKVSLKIGGGRYSLWDADHKLEVVKGGGECGLDGMQTLCLWCHRAKTARLVSDLAAQRKETK